MGLYQLGYPGVRMKKEEVPVPGFEPGLCRF